MTQDESSGRRPPDGRSSHPSDPDSGRSVGEEAAEILAEVMRDQKERRTRQEAAGRRPGGRSQGPIYVLAAVLAVLTLFVWTSPPSFARPSPLPEPSAEKLEAGLRMEMFGAVVQIERYREETGEIPRSLDEVMEDPSPDIRYTPLPPSYYLTGHRSGQEVVYRSDDPVQTLMAEARRQVEAGDR